MTTQELFHLRDQALSLVGARPEAEARIRVLREMFDAGLEAMAERLGAAQAEAEKARALAEQVEQRDELLRASEDRERLQTLRISSLRSELDALREEEAALRAARDAAEAETRSAQERVRSANGEAAIARSETELAVKQTYEERTRAEIATSEAASAQVESIQAGARMRAAIDEAARLRSNVASLEDALRATAALADERIASLGAERDRARADMSAARLDAMDVRERLTATLTELVTARSARDIAEAPTASRLPFVGNARGEMTLAAPKRS